jgi:hypothetical protein
VCKCWTQSVELGLAQVLSFGTFGEPGLIQWQWDDHRSAYKIVGPARRDGLGTGRVGGEVLLAEPDYCARIRSKPLWAASRKKCHVG